MADSTIFHDNASNMLALVAYSHLTITGARQLVVNSADAASVMNQDMNDYIFGNCSIGGFEGPLAIISDSSSGINSFLTENGFDPTFGEHPLEDFGIASILKVTIEWPKNVARSSIIGPDAVAYQAVRVPTDNVKIFDLSGHVTLAQINFAGGGSLWLRTAEQPSVHTLTDIASLSMDSAQSTVEDYTSVVVPNMSINAQSKIGWLQAARIDNHHQIERATCYLRLRTAITGSDSIIPEESSFYFDRPYICWFTKPGNDCPMVITYVCPDSWVTL